MPIQARTEFAAAINQIASEKGVDTSVIINAIEEAALAAYRKDLSFRNEAVPEDFDDLIAKINPSSGEIGIYRGEENITPPGFARIAAQTAKQVMAQKLHEAEKGAILDEYAQKVGTVVSGAIQRQEGNTYFVDLGRAEGIMPPGDQVRDEYYGQNQRMKFFIKEIRDGGKGPEVVVSRTDEGLVKGLFGMEVPEIQSGSVTIEAISREAGGRTKVAVASNQDGVDPVGSLVGQKGVRVQAVINELGEEKIDIVPYSGDPSRFIASALSPAKDVQVTLDEEAKVAKVKIPESQLSLAIGKGGQNVRLAAKLTGWKIDIEGLEEPKTLEEKIEQKDGSTGSTQDDSDTASDDQTSPQTTDDTAQDAVEQVEKDIDQATKEESLDGATQPEPTAEEASEVAAQAEEDIASDPEMNKDDIEVAPAADFEKVEEEKIAKEAAVKDQSDE
jgi:transcription termination/antitermination protein NusA